MEQYFYLSMPEVLTYCSTLCIVCSGIDIQDDEEIKKLEDKMAAAGDDIIWNTLKFTGAHKDEVLSPEQLAQVKSYIIKKLTSAYRLAAITNKLQSHTSTIDYYILLSIHFTNVVSSLLCFP